MRADRRGAGEVGVDAAAADLKLHGQRDGPVVAVHVHGVGIGAGGDPLDGGPDGRGGAVEDEGGDGLDVVEAQLVEHVVQALDAGVVAGGQRVDVTHHLVGLADVGSDHRDQVAVEAASLGQLHHRYEQPLLVDLRGVGPEAPAADVHHVGGGAEVGDQPVGPEHGGDHGDVVEVAGALPGVVGEVDVAGVYAMGADPLDEVIDRRGHGVDVAGRAGDGLGHHPAFRVEDPGRQVPGLTHAGAEGGAHQAEGLLLHHRDQPVPHHLQSQVPGLALRVDPLRVF